jgi:hypothetical protein
VKVIDPGHDYALQQIDGDGEQRLLFVKREGARYPGNVGHHPGVTMQEVIRALLHRARYVHNQIPCYETETAIRCFQIALAAMEQRHARIKGRHLHVERSLEDIELGEVCRHCGHIGCMEHS